MFTEDFPPVPANVWEEKIKEDLQGADYDRKLIWETLDGYRIRPYYRAADLEGINYLESHPGRFPYLRGSGSGDNTWFLRQDFQVSDAVSGNREALEILNGGVSSIGFDLSALGKTTKKDIQTLLKGIPLEEVHVNFILNGNFLEFLNGLQDFAADQNIDPVKIRGSISCNPLGMLTAKGISDNDTAPDLSDLGRCLEFVRDHLPSFRVIHNCGNVFHESGASVTQELAATLSMGNEYLVELMGMGHSLEDILPRMQFRFSIGSSYFMEIAKLRAARYLWSRILEAYPSFSEKVPAMYILSQTSGWNQTLYDPHVNMLRATTEAMSAILGGTDSLNILPFDLPVRGSNSFSRRIARNIQIILRDESYLDKVKDPAAGSYYIEVLTDTLLSGAWDLFLRMEEKGGYRKSLEDGFIQEMVNQTSGKRLDNLANRKEILLGTNQYPIQGEKAGKAEKREPQAVPQPGKKQIIAPLETSRGAKEFEDLRLGTERHPGKQPVVFIIPLGNLAMRRARAMFTMNFFGCAGFNVIDNIGKFKTVKEGVDAARIDGADIVVLCSSDDEYPSMAADLVSLAGKDLIPVIAGYPKKHLDILKKAGVQYFIHVRSNVLEELKNYQKLLGI
jgi:methylmalonyl-CoA mutase